MDSSFTACTTTSLQNRHCFTATKQNSNLLHVLLHCFSFAILPCWRCLKPKSPTAIAYNSRRTIVFKGHIEWQHWSFMPTNVVSVYAVGWILSCKSALTALVSPITRVLYKVKGVHSLGGKSFISCCWCCSWLITLSVQSITVVFSGPDIDSQAKYIPASM